MTVIEGGRFVVTGGAGFIGSHLVDGLLDRGAASVVVVDSLELGSEANLRDDRRVELVPYRLGFDAPKLLDAALAGARGLFHLAAAKHNQKQAAPEDILQSNVLGTHRLLLSAREAGISKVVFASSLYAYGREHGPLMEEHEVPAPQTVYGVSKLAGEHLLRAVLEPAQIPHVSLRYFFVYGPRQSCGKGRNSVIVESLTRLLRGEAPRLYGSGDQAFDYIYVTDVVRATVLAMVKKLSHSTLNVATGRGVRVADLLRACAEQCERPDLPAVAGPADATDQTSRIGSTVLACRELGFEADVPFEEGIRRTLAWMRGADASLLEGILRCSAAD